MNDIAFPKPSMTAKDIFKDQIAATKEDAPTLFSLKAQMLDQGRTDTVLAATEDLSVRLKVYASVRQTSRSRRSRIVSTVAAIRWEVTRRPIKRFQSSSRTACSSGIEIMYHPGASE